MNLLAHPSIVKLHQVLTTPQHVYIVMELVTGGELWDLITSTEGGGLPEWEARRYFRELVDGVSHCHSRGVYHRDLKPENLLLDEYDCLKITDFGLSTLKQGLENVNDVLHTQCGTPNYVPPEIIDLPKDGYSGAKVDVWSCGVILYVMVAGAMPFVDDDFNRLFEKIKSGTVEYPSWFSPSLISLLSILFRVNHQERATLEEIRKHPWFTHQLQNYYEDVSMTAPTSVSVPHGPLLAKTKSVHMETEPGIDAASDGLGDRQASDFTDYTLDLSVSELGKITLRETNKRYLDRTETEKSMEGRHRSHSDVCKPPSRAPSSTSRRKSSFDIHQESSSRRPLTNTLSEASMPVGSYGATSLRRVALSSSSDSDDGGGESIREQEPSINETPVIMCVICGEGIALRRAQQQQLICDVCYESRMQSATDLMPERRALTMMPRHEGLRDSSFSSLDEGLFRSALEREDRTETEQADGLFEFDSNGSYHIVEDWEVGCVHELEEHGRVLRKLNDAWSMQLQARKTKVEPTKDHDTELKRTNSIQTHSARNSVGEKKKKVKITSSPQTGMFRNPSRPWVSPVPMEDASKRQHKLSNVKNVLRDPFVTSRVTVPKAEHRSRLMSSDFLPDPCRDQALQEIANTGTQLSEMITGPIAPPGSNVPRVIEGLRTLKHRGQQRKVFDSLCPPSLLTKILRTILEDMKCETQIRETRSDGFKISTTMRPPEVHATLSTKIEVYRKSDDLSKVSARKTKGTRQDFLTFFATVKDRYAQSVRNLLL